MLASGRMAERRGKCVRVPASPRVGWGLGTAVAVGEEELGAGIVNANLLTSGVSCRDVM